MSIQTIQILGDGPVTKYGYKLLQRAKKGKPWVIISECQTDGQQCLAGGEVHLLKHSTLTDAQRAMVVWDEDKDSRPWIAHAFYTVFRVVGNDEWHRIQVSQHLKQVSGKR